MPFCSIAVLLLTYTVDVYDRVEGSCVNALACCIVVMNIFITFFPVRLIHQFSSSSSADSAVSVAVLCANVRDDGPAMGGNARRVHRLDRNARTQCAHEVSQP